MKTNTKNNIAQALIDMDALNKTLKEESRKTVKALLQESIKDALNDSIEDDEDKDDEEYTISDEKDTNSDANVGEDSEDEKSEGCEDGNCPVCDDKDNEEGDSDDEASDEEGSDDESGDDEWSSEFSDYKDKDGNLDFSDRDDDATDKAIIKVYKLLKDSDQVIVKKDGDRAELKDNETGAEYVIDFGDGDVEKVEDGNNDFSDDSTNEEESLNERFGMDGNDIDYQELQDMPIEDEDSDDYGEEEESTVDPETEDEIAQEIDRIAAEGGNTDEEGAEGGMPDDEYEDPMEDAEGPMGVEPNDDEQYMAENKSRKARKTMKENKEKVLFEVDLGYTDNYQSKDPIEGLSAEEPAKDKKDWDAGVPKGTKKPWAGKGDSAPFDSKAKNDLNEMELSDEEPIDGAEEFEGDELAEADSKARKRSTAKTHLRQNEMNPKGTRHASKNGKYFDKIEESAEYQKLVKENKALKTAALALKKNLEEAVLLNVNLGQVVKLIQENTTTKAERVDFINRFDKVKSINESKALYESISRELASVKKPSVTLEEKQMTAAGTQKLNESKVYENPALAEIRNMMSRMDKKNFI